MDIRDLRDLVREVLKEEIKYKRKQKEQRPAILTKDEIKRIEEALSTFNGKITLVKNGDKRLTIYEPESYQRQKVQCIAIHKNWVERRRKDVPMSVVKNAPLFDSVTTNK
jgi:hypothetical protein